MKVPILFIIFNRPDIAAASFEAIRQYRPERLYIAADGPRESRPGEDELCRQTRERILGMIDWPCDVRTLFRPVNIGVDFGVYGAINWMFETEPWGVIIEDDCYVSQDFFSLCEDAFPRYSAEPRVVHIVANNPWTKLRESNRVEFTYYPMSWGWATWADKWKRVMDTEMTAVPGISLMEMIRKFGWFQGMMFYRNWNATYRRRERFQTWDSIWQYSVMHSDFLCLLPMVNLAVNNGIGTCEGSHFDLGDKNYYEGLEMGKLDKPYSYPAELYIASDIRRAERREYMSLRFFGLKKKIKNLLNATKRG